MNKPTRLRFKKLDEGDFLLTNPMLAHDKVIKVLLNVSTRKWKVFTVSGKNETLFEGSSSFDVEEAKRDIKKYLVFIGVKFEDEIRQQKFKEMMEDVEYEF